MTDSFAVEKLSTACAPRAARGCGRSNAGASFVHVGDEARAFEVEAVDLHRRESPAHQGLHRPVEMAAAGDRPPERRQALLPARDVGLRRETVLDEEELAARP